MTPGPTAGAQADTESAGTEKTADQIAADKKVADDKATAEAAVKATADAAAAKAAEAETKRKADEATAASKAPEKYALTLPKGGRVDESDVKALETLAKKEGWTNEQAQQALDDHAASLEAMSSRFLEESQAHAEIGGEHLVAAQKHANAVLDRFLPAGEPEGASSAESVGR